MKLAIRIIDVTAAIVFFMPKHFGVEEDELFTPPADYHELDPPPF